MFSHLNCLLVNCGTLSCKKTRYKEEYSLTTIEINRKTRDAKIDVLLLNNDPPEWSPRFHGSYLTLDIPEKSEELIADIIQIGNTEFSGSYNEENYEKAIEKINQTDCDIIIHR